MIEFLIIFAVLMMIVLGIGYAIANRIVGHEAAIKRLQDAILCTLLGIFLAFAFQSLGKHAWISFCFLFAVIYSLWLLSWIWRKKKAGDLLLNVGQLSENKILFWIGVFEVVLALLNTWFTINRVPQGLPVDNLVEVISQLVFLWTLAIFLLSLGCSKLELRENGICYMFSVIKWEKLASYKWKPGKPNVLTINLKQADFPLLQKTWNVPIPLKYRDAVDGIMAKYLMKMSKDI